VRSPTGSRSGIVILAKLLFGGIRRTALSWPRPRPVKGRPLGGNPWKGRHGRDDWRLYHDFWEQEGKEAFERFRQKKDAEGGGGIPGGGSGGASRVCGLADDERLTDSAGRLPAPHRGPVQTMRGPFCTTRRRLDPPIPIV